MKIRYLGMATETAKNYWAGGRDDDGNVIEEAISPGEGIPCRHCLQGVAAGDGYLILAHRPFPGKGPYSEMGPVFLHASPCASFISSEKPPAMFARRSHFLMRAYDSRNRIIYGSGGPVETEAMSTRAQELLKHPEAAYVHVRSIGYSCFLCRIEPDQVAAAASKLEWCALRDEYLCQNVSSEDGRHDR